MNLLLLLSALLSALSGAVTGGRVERAPQAVSAQAIAASIVRTAAIPAVTRPANCPPGLASLSRSFSGYRYSPRPAEPLYAARRRE